MSIEIEKIKLKAFNDAPDGNLFIAESLRSIPFQIKRLYYINELGDSKATRGKHAHKKLEQAIFCINGSFVLDVDDGKHRKSISMDDPSVGIRLRPMIWHTMHDFSKHCVLMVLASDYFKESDYIRNYDEFLKLCA